MGAKRNWAKIFEAVGKNDKEINKINLERFSEKSEVEHYAKTDDIRAHVLQRKFIKSRNKKILDAGCASGAVSFTLTKYGHRIKGIDYSEEMIKLAKKIKKENRIKGVDFETMNILDLREKEKYDFVICLYNTLSVFSSEKDRVRALSNMIRSLKKNGILILDLVNRNGSLRLLAKSVFFKIIFTFSGKKHIFGDVYSNPLYEGASLPLFQHFLSRAEISRYLRKFNLESRILYYNLWTDKKDKKTLFLIAKKA